MWLELGRGRASRRRKEQTVNLKDFLDRCESLAIPNLLSICAGSRRHYAILRDDLQNRGGACASDRSGVLGSDPVWLRQDLVGCGIEPRIPSNASRRLHFLHDLTLYRQ